MRRMNISTTVHNDQVTLCETKYNCKLQIQATEYSLDQSYKNKEVLYRVREEWNILQQTEERQTVLVTSCIGTAF
jgi:hypothetical protein